MAHDGAKNNGVLSGLITCLVQPDHTYGFEVVGSPHGTKDNAITEFSPTVSWVGKMSPAGCRLYKGDSGDGGSPGWLGR
jgi:hypothetical protein